MEEEAIYTHSGIGGNTGPASDLWNDFQEGVSEHDEKKYR